MNPISHAQARLWLSMRLDGRELPDAQWAALQAHLEGCAECRAFAAEQAEEERCLRHALRVKLAGRQGPQAWVAREVVTQRRARVLRRQISWYAALAVLTVLLLAGYMRYRQVYTPPPPPVPAAAAPRPTSTPSPTFAFRGVIAYSAPANSAAGNNRDIFLLTYGHDGPPDRANLTNHPADDASPAWSWDGQWLAFLSNRTASEASSADQPAVGRKYEVYVINVSGSRLVRLTERPDVDWQGPISWSADGQMLALRGTMRGEQEPRVFLVPLDGVGARSLAFTRGVDGPPRFSPIDMQLAYSLGIEGVMAFGPRENQWMAVSLQPYDRPFYSGGPVFAWSPVNLSLAYLVEGSYAPANSSADTVTMIQGAYVSMTAGVTNIRQSTSPIATLPGARAVRGLAWSPDPASANVLAAVSDRQSSGCWYVALYQTSTAGTPLHEYPELCVDGPLEASSWTSDGRWLVLLAHPADGSAPVGLYALRMDMGRASPTRFERLAGGEAAAGSGLPTGSNDELSGGPQVRPSRSPKTDLSAVAPSDPHPAAPAQPLPPPSLPPAGTPGEILFNAQASGLPQGMGGYGMTGSGLAQVRPDGGARAVITNGEYTDTCPAWSPDRSHIAFLSNRAGELEDMGRDVFVMAADGQYITRLTRAVIPQPDNYSGPVFYGCPVWSPDGSKLAARVNAYGQSYLAILPVDGGQAGYIPMNGVSYATGPVWSPGGTRVLLAHFASNGENADHARAYIEAIDLLGPDAQPTPAPTEHYRLPTPGETAPTAAPPGPPSLPYTSTRLIESDGWEDVFGLGYTPGGDQFAFLAVQKLNVGSRPYVYSLFLADSNGQNVHRVALVMSADRGFYTDSNPLLLLPDGQVSFLIRHAMSAAYKTEVYKFHLYETEQPQPVARLEDLVYAAAWSPDGRWLAFSSDAGLSVLDTRGQASPALLEQQRVYWVDWK